jgi:hypothetical protein
MQWVNLGALRKNVGMTLKDLQLPHIAFFIQRSMWSQLHLKALDI